MKKFLVFVLLGGFVLPSTSLAADLKQAKFTQVVNSVDVISTSDKSRHVAAVNDNFKMPDVVRTGPASRAELIGTDDTITRVGANTIFSFDPANRTIDLQQGSLLFHAPHGKGGGTIHTGSATASVLGTTIIVTTTPGGGFKVLVLEGEAEIRFLNGLHITLTPGQMTFILPGGGTSPIVVFRLDDETRGSLLVSGFDHPLPSWGKIQTEVTRQLLLLLNNKLQDTDLVVGDNATPDAVQVRMDLLGPGSPFDTDGQIISVDKTSNDPLPVNYPPLDPTHVVNGPFTPPPIPSFTEGLEFLGIGTPASGFVGRNIDIDTGWDVPIDLSSFAGNSDFDIMAAQDLRIWQTTIFSGPIEEPSVDSGNMPDTVSLIAGGKMLVAQYSTLQADTGTFGLVADSFGVLDISTDSSFDTTAGTADANYPNTLLNVSIINNVGDVDILSLQDLTIEGMNWDCSDYTVFAGGNVNIQSDGNLTLGTDDDETVSQLDGERNYNVLIDAGADVTLSAGLASGGNMNILDTEIYAGDSGLGESSFTGGSLNINAGGYVYIYGSDLNAYSGEFSDGDVNIFGVSTVDLEDTYVYADGQVNIESGDTLYLGWDRQDDSYFNEIEAYGSVFLTSDYSDVDIWGYDIYSYYGDVDINAAGDVNVVSSDISAGGDVNINSGGVYGLVDINSSSGYGDVYISDSDIYAGYDNDYGFSAGSVNVTAAGNVTICGSDIYATKDVNITSEGGIYVTGNNSSSGGNGVDIEYSEIYAGDTGQGGQPSSSGGDVNINAYDNEYNGSVYMFGDDVYAYAGSGSESSSAGGNVTIYGSGGVDVEDTYIQADNEVDIETPYNLYIGWNDGYYDNNGIDAGGLIYLASYYADVDILEYNIQSYYNNVDISAAGDVKVYDSSIYAGQDVNIGSGGIVLDTLDSSGLGDVYISESDIFAGYNTSSGGSVNIAAPGNVSIDGSDVYAYDNVNISSEGTIGPRSINNVTGGIDIEDSTIYAGFESSESQTQFSGGASPDGGNVTITANNGNVYLSGDDIEAFGGGSENPENLDGSGLGNVTIYAFGTADVEDTTIYGDGSVSIESVDLLTLGNVNGDDIEAQGCINLTSDNAEVAIYDTQIYAYRGDVYITAPGNIHIEENTYIDAGGDVNINSGGSFNPGDVNNSSVDIENAFITSGYDYNCGPSWSGGSVYINANNGDVVMVADVVTAYGGYCDNGDVSITASDNINIDKTTITADGDVTMQANNNLTVGPGDDVTINAGGDISLTGNNNVDVEFTTAEAGGSVSLYSFGNIYTSDSTLTADDGNVNATSYYGNVQIQDSTLNAGEDLDIQAGYWDNGGEVVLMDNVTVNAGDSVTIDAPGYVEIDNSTISAGNNNGNIDIEFQWPVEDSSLYFSTSGGDLTIDGGGEVYISNTTIDLHGDITVESSGLFADDGNVTLVTDGTTTVSGDSILFLDSSITGNNISISDSTVQATGGDVDIYNHGSVSFSASSYVDISDSTISLNNIDICDSDIFAEGGNVNIISDGSLSVSDVDSYDVSGSTISLNNITICDSLIFATGDVNITSAGSVSVDTINSSSLAGQNIDIEGTTVYAGYDANGDAPSVGGGNVNINAYSGNVYLSGDDIEAYGGASVTQAANVSGPGNVNIYGYGTVVVDSSYVSAANDVYIESGDTLTLESVSSGNNDIQGGNSVNLTSDYGDVDISDTYISTGLGDVNITAWNDVDVEYSDIDQAGAVNVNADGNVTIADVINNNYDSNGSDTYLENWNITSYYWNVYISADENVGIYNSSIYAYDDVNIQSGGMVCLTVDGSVTSGGNIDIENTTIYAGYDTTLNPDSIGGASFDGGSVTITANNGDVYLSGDDIRAFSGEFSDGDVTITGIGGDVDVESTYIQAGGNVDIEADGKLTINAGHVFDIPTVAGIGGFDIYAVGDVTLDGSCVKIKDTAIYAGDEVDVTADNGNVKIKDAFIQTADGDINVTANSGDLTLDLGCQDYGVDLEAGGNVKLTADYSVNINGSLIQADGGDVTINAGGGGKVPTTSDAHNRQFSMTYAAFQDGPVLITPADTTVSGDTFNYFGGDYTFNDVADGNETIQNSAIDIVNGTLYITGGINVTLNDNTAANYDNSGLEGYYGVVIYASEDVSANNDNIYSLGGDVDITANDGSMDLEGVYIDANGQVNLESWGSLSLGYDSDSGSTIYAGSAVNITSDDSNIDIYNYNIYADYWGNGPGDLDITAYNGSVYITANSTLDAYDGNVNINGADWVGIYNTDICASGDVNVWSYGTVTLNGSGSLQPTFGSQNTYSVDAGGSVNLTSTFNDVDVYNYDINAYNGQVNLTANSGDIDMECSHVEAGGDVTLYAYNGMYLNYDCIISDTGDINITDEGSINQAIVSTSGALIANTWLMACDGGVNINNEDGIGLYNDWILAGNGDVDINSFFGSIDLQNSCISAGGDVNIGSYYGTVTLGGFTPVSIGGGSGDTIHAGGSVGIETFWGDVDIYCSSIYAYGGELDVTADIYDVNIFDSTLAAGSDSNVSITGLSSISASDNVYINANGGNIDIYAGNNLTIIGTTFDLGGNITISDSTITANNGDVDIYSYGSLSITSFGTVDVSGNTVLGGNINISDSTITASGNVNIGNEVSLTLPEGEAPDTLSPVPPVAFDVSSANNIDITGSTITANGGDVTISAPGHVEIGYSDISASGLVNVTAGDYVNINDDSVYLDGWNITAGTDVNLTADNGINDDSDYSVVQGGPGYGGVVSISSVSSISAEGDVLIAAGAGFYEGGAFNNSDYSGGVYDSGNGGDADISGSSVSAGGGVTISAGSGIAEGGAYNDYSGNGTGGKVDISSGSAISADLNVVINGGAGIHDGGAYERNSGSGTGGDVDISDSSVTGGETVNISSGAGIVDSGAYNTFNTVSGNNGAGGIVDISSSSTISATSDVNISGGDGINDSGAFNYNYVNGTGGEVDVSGSSVTAGGSVHISGGNGISLTGSFDNNYGIGTGGDVSISDSSITATAGDVTISGGSGLLIGGAYNSNYGSSAGDGDVNITSGSTISALNGNVTISAGGDVDVNNSTLTAKSSASGTVGITSIGKTTIENGSTVSGFYLNVNSDNGILIDGTSGGGVHLSGNTMNLTGNSSDVNVNSTDLANYATVNIQGHTVNMDNVNFASGSSYNFTVFNHDFYINNGHQDGYANFNNDTLDGNTIHNTSGSTSNLHPSNDGGIILGGSGAGIHVN